jgi:large subunit ribosomal protein L24
MANKLKIKKGDKVVIVAGKDKGKKGEVIRVMPAKRRALVQGVNMVTRHTRPTQTSAGGLMQVEAPLDISNLAIEDPKTGEPTRVGYKILDDGRKVRFAKRSGEVIDL